LKRIFPLATIEIFVWLFLLLCALLVSKVAYSINLGNANLTERIATQVVRNSLAGVIVIGWLLVWKRVTDSYLRRALRRQAAKI
jgi:hypothetical protein